MTFAVGRRKLLGIPVTATLWVAAGTALLGASGYAFLTLTARRVPAEEYAALASLYLLVALVGPALFIPVEQETTRLVSRAHALGLGTRDTIRRMGRLSAIMVALATVVLIALSPVLVDRVFHGQAGLWVALVLSTAGYGGACVLRGVYAGQRRMKAYAACVGVDGLTRLVPCVAFAAIGLGSALPYGLALGFGSVVAFAAVLPWYRSGGPGPAPAWREVTSATSWLVAAWGFSLALSNIAPVVVTALMHDDARRAGIFAFAFVISRVPVFLLVSVQAIILPALTRSAASEDRAGLGRAVRQAVIAVAGLGVAAVVITPVLSRWIIGLLFGLPNALSTPILVAIACGAVPAMLVQVLQPALIAVASHRLVAAAWFVGAIVFTVSFMIPATPIGGATLAQVTGATATAAVMGVALSRRLRRPSR